MNNNVADSLRAIVQNIDNSISQLIDNYRSAHAQWSDKCYEHFLNNSNAIVQVGEQFSNQVEAANSQIDHAISTINSAMQRLEYL